MADVAASRQASPVRDVGAAWRRRIARSLRVMLYAILVLALAFAAATARVLVWPAEGMPAHVSAIVMLAGSGDRMTVALQLAREHRAQVLVVSQGYEGYGSPCPARPPGMKLICFDPNPATTRGEAEYVGQLAAKYHWTAIVIVTSRPQATRARLYFKRCFTGTVYNATGPLLLHEWPTEIVYGWGALAKAVFNYQSC